MTKKEFVQEIEYLKVLMSRREKVVEMMFEVGFRPEAPVLDIIYKYEDALVDSISKRVGETLKSSWCQWFVFDNDFGKKELKAYIKDKEYIIKSPVELYDFIQEYYELTK